MTMNKLELKEQINKLDRSHQYTNKELATILDVPLAELSRNKSEIKNQIRKEFEGQLWEWKKGKLGLWAYSYVGERKTKRIHYHPSVILRKSSKVSIKQLQKFYGYSLESWEQYVEEELSQYSYEIRDGHIVSMMELTEEEFMEEHKKLVDKVKENPDDKNIANLISQASKISDYCIIPEIPSSYTKAQKKKIIDLEDQYDQSEWIKGKGLFETNMERLLNIHSTKDGACYYFTEKADEAFMVAVAEYLREPDLQPRKAIATKENAFNSGRANTLVKQTQELIDMIAYFWDDIQERREHIPKILYKKAHNCLLSSIQAYNLYQGELVHEIRFRRYRPQLIEHVPQVDLKEQITEVEKNLPSTLQQRFEAYQEAQRNGQ